MGRPIFFFDLDGSGVEHGSNEIPEGTRKAFIFALRHNVRLVPVTGRSRSEYLGFEQAFLSSVNPSLDPDGRFGFLRAIINEGAEVHDPRGSHRGSTFHIVRKWRSFLPVNTIRKVLEVAASHGAMVKADDILDGQMGTARHAHAEVEERLGSHPPRHIHCPRLAIGVSRVLYPDFLSELSQNGVLHGGSVSVFEPRAYNPDLRVIRLLPEGEDKATGIKRFCATSKVKRHEVGFVGNDESDVTALLLVNSWGGFSRIMPEDSDSLVPEITRAGSITEGGFADALREFVETVRH